VIEMNKKHMELLTKSVQGKILNVERLEGLDYKREFMGDLLTTHIVGTGVLRDGFKTGTFYRVDFENEIETLVWIYEVRETNFSDFDKETTFEVNISAAECFSVIRDFRPT
jgi:hypothetical protein